MNGVTAIMERSDEVSDHATEHWVPVDGRNLDWCRSYAVAQSPRGYVCWGIRNTEHLYLIAAAPELADAVYTAKEAIESWYFLTGDPDYKRVAAKLDTAIAKAEGRDE